MAAEDIAKIARRDTPRDRETLEEVRRKIAAHEAKHGALLPRAREE